MKTVWLLCGLLLLLPCDTHAHGTLGGTADFIHGALHPLATPFHLLLLIGLGLMGGREKIPQLISAMKAFVPGTFVGLAGVFFFSVPPVPSALLAAASLGAGLFLAINKSPNPWGIGLVYGSSGFLMGIDSEVDAASALPLLKFLLGTWISLSVIVFNAAFYASLVRERAWAKVGVRIAGSWIMAIGVLMLAFSIRETRASSPASPGAGAAPQQTAEAQMKNQN
ncbi:MAG: hypothetical protein FJ405_17225 [Verrucomicrobia bacterium]|nr:hypothetical protein [Verrucomicrobiota bacterium]